MRLLKAIYWRIKIIKLSLRRVNKICLGDTVIYKGKRYSLYQGVNSPYWKLSLIGGKEHIEAHSDEFVKEKSIKNYWGSFKSGYRFYMTSWYEIWMREGIKPWMKSLPIWGD